MKLKTFEKIRLGKIQPLLASEVYFEITSEEMEAWVKEVWKERFPDMEGWEVKYIQIIPTLRGYGISIQVKLEE